MNRNKSKLLLITVLAVTCLLAFTLVTYAAGTLTISADQTQITPTSKVSITVKELTADNLPPTEDITVRIKVSRGGTVNPAISRTGLVLKSGIGTFEYIAPSKTGKVDILVINPNNNLSAKLTLEVVEAQAITSWKPEYAQLSKVKGKVAVKYKNKTAWDTAFVGMSLNEGDTVMTWEKSWSTLQLFDGSELTLQPGTILMIKSLKSSVNVKQSVFKVVTGKVLAKAKEYLEKGSKFEIESESATAGVQGTVFEFSSMLDGANELIVYEGKVLMEQVGNELSTLLGAGQRAFFNALSESLPSVEEHTITPEQIEQIIQTESESVPEETEEPETTPEPETSESATPQPTAQPTAASTPQPVNNQQTGDSAPTMDVGCGTEKTVTGDVCFAIHLQPELRRILGSPISVGFDLVFYQDPNDPQNIVFGYPDFDNSSESKPFYNFINWLEYDGKYLYLYWGDLTNITYDLGLLFSGYTKEEARGMQFGLKNILVNNLGTKVLVPMDIKSFHPWEMVETSTLYAGRIWYSFKLGPLPNTIGATYVQDTYQGLAEKDVPTSGYSFDYSMPLSSLLMPYAEAAFLNSYGSGSEIGIMGKFLMFQYKGGYRMYSDKFVANYFGGNYEEKKYNELLGATYRTLPDLNTYTASNGYFLDIGAKLGDFLNVQVGYEDYNNLGAIAPVLKGGLDFKTPRIASVPQVILGATYLQTNFNSDPNVSFRDEAMWLNNKTEMAWYVKYPLGGGLFATMTNTYYGPDKGFVREISLSTQM